MYSNGFRKKLSSQNPFFANNKSVGNTVYKGGAPLMLTGNLKLVNKLANNGFNTTKSLNYTTGSEVTKLSG